MPRSIRGTYYRIQENFKKNCVFFIHFRPHFIHVLPPPASRLNESNLELYRPPMNLTQIVDVFGILNCI